MTSPVPPPLTPRQRLDRLLDGGFNTEAQRINQAYSRALSRGILAQRLTEIQQEAARLEAAGQRLTPDNPILRALYADLEAVLGREMAGVLSASSGNLEEQAIQAARGLTRDIALGGVDNATLARLGFRFNVPNPDTIISVVNLTGSQAFNDYMDAFGTQETEKIRNVILSNIVAGKSPLFIAKLLSNTVDGLPRSDMNTFLRTLQLTSYRKAQDAIAMANKDILEKKIRIASLDGRCCLACISLHGTELKIDESVIDHHNGRCTAILVVKGRPMYIRTGEEWFNAQPEERRRAIAGDANFNAMQAGKVKLSDFAGKYQDDLFGEMLREKSLKDILGKEAGKYYSTPKRSTSSPQPPRTTTTTNTSGRSPYTPVEIGTEETAGVPIPPRQ